jgi:hypothetical protein
MINKKKWDAMADVEKAESILKAECVNPPHTYFCDWAREKKESGICGVNPTCNSCLEFMSGYLVHAREVETK